MIEWRRVRLLAVLAGHETTVLAVPLLAGLVVGELTAGRWHGFLATALLLVALPFVEGVLFWQWELTQGMGAETGGAVLQRRILARLLSFPVSWFVTRRTGEIVTTTTGDVQYLVAHNRFWLEVLRGLYAVTVIGTILCTQHPLLLVTVVVAVTPQALNLYASRRASDRVATDIVTGTAAMNEYFRERLDILPLTRACGAADWEIARCAAVVEQDLLDRQLAQTGVDRSVALRAAAIQGVGLLALLLGGGWLAVSGRIGVGGLVMAYGYFARVGIAVTAWTAWRRRSGEARARSGRIREVLDTPSQPTGTMPPPMTVDRVELRDVVFAHPDRPRVLDGASLTLRRGEVVALVGPSGSGKSTVADLLAGLAEPTSGQILVNGELALTDIDRKAWLCRLCYAPQFPYFFTDSLDANMRYGTDVASQPPDERVAELAGVLGMDTVFERARDGQQVVRGLSGGQRQRLGLLRAYLRGSPLLTVFDEPTSAVDTLTEERVMALLLRLRELAPVLLIAHRPSTIRHADRVVALRHGKIVDDRR